MEIKIDSWIAKGIYAKRTIQLYNGSEMKVSGTQTQIQENI